MISRKISDLVTFIHEYTHSLFLHLQRQRASDISEMREKLKQDASWEYYNTADSAFNEGLAVMMESITEYQIRLNPEKYGFKEEELPDLAAPKEGRYKRFKESIRSGNKDSYVEGTLGIMHRVYKAALRGVKDKDDAIPEGVQAMFDLVSRLDPQVTFVTKRTDPEYQQVLKDRAALENFYFTSE